MSVETLGVAQNYQGDGGTSLFPYPNYVLEPLSLVVIVTTNGVPVIMGLNAQPGFTFAGTTDEYGSFPNGGNVQLTDINGNPAPPAAGASVLITRNTKKIQPQSYIDNSPLPGPVLEHGLDRLTCIVQEIAGGLANFLGELPGPPPYGNLCDWFVVCPPVPGGPWGYTCTQAAAGSTPAVWNVIADISW